LIVDRERERMDFVSASYWDLVATFKTEAGETFEATLSTYQGKSIPATRDFDPKTGKLKNPNLLLLDEAAARQLAERLLGAQFTVSTLDDKPYTTRPYPPFTTSTMQQEANRKLGFTARRTMQVAQSLYENGHITYMRTDSTNLANVAVEAARDLVALEYGKEYLPSEARVYRTKVKNAQEAHEAIRPAGHPFELPEKLRGELQADEYRLFELIWKRTIASQMADARGRRIQITVAGADAEFQASGKTIDFAGYLRAYVEGSDDPDAELADRETVLPAVSVSNALRCVNQDPKVHTTQPPARYTEATLTKALEEMGIGRPSTYATIIDTILAREYVVKKSNALVPTWTAFAVSQLLEAHLPTLVDYRFTAKMEDDLDSISRGETDQVEYLRGFYFGGDSAGLKPQLANKINEIDAAQVNTIPLARHGQAGGEDIVVRVGRFGPFLQQGDRRATIPEDVVPDELTIERAQELLSHAAAAEQPLGTCPTTGKPIFVKSGRFGPYVQLGTSDDEEKPKYASLLKGMKPDQVDLPTALKLLSLPRTLGNHPQSNEPVVASNGRFGPYIKCGAETRSLPAEMSPIDVTLEQALALLAQPKQARRGFGAPRTPLRVMGESPVTKEPIQMFSGRYGLYVTDGTSNASLPKGTTAEELTMDEALQLLAERAAKGPAKPKRGARRSKSKAG
jgi:DNA topoisomerase-1